jgi:uncharacterized protein GlcG (DUF336 family)
MNHRTLSMLGTALSIIVPLSGSGAGLRTQRIISTALAVEAAQVAMSDCEAKGWNVSVVVVDPNGDIIASMRNDRAGMHTLEVARRKAYTAAVSHTATAIWGANVAAGKRPPDPNLVYVEPLLLAPGGVPILVGDEEVGAIGVSGGIGANADASCADAGINKVSERLK